MLRLCTWNIQSGRRLPAILESLASLEQLDLIALQEASTHNGAEDAVAVAAALGPTYQAFQVTAHLFPDGVDQGNAVVWDSRRIQATATGAFKLPEPSGRVLSRIRPQNRNAVVLESLLD
ncbi:MAG TPA: hypothetical protein VF134_09890, partial [Candidatus Dormibacteraeota bacterium]